MNNTTEIYYFSGTGNSLYVAGAINKRLASSKLFSIPAIMNKFRENTNLKKDKNIIKTHSDSVGFVFPCHGVVIPVIVKRFLERFDISSSSYIFAIVTRGGSVFHGFNIINKILGKQDKELDASFVITMANNDSKLKTFYIPSEEEFKKIEKKVAEKVDSISKIILNQRTHHDDVDGISFTRYKWINYILERVIPFLMFKFSTKIKNYFYSDSTCTGCGICEKMCLSNKISMEDGKPVWQQDIECYLCYGCLNYCPNEAIQIHSTRYMTSFTKEKGRYPHPYASVKDMVNQKQNRETTYIPPMVSK